MPTDRNHLLPLALPLAYLAHLAEEWWGGFVPWSQQYGPMTGEKFLVLNAVIWPALVVAAILAWRFSRFGVAALVVSAVLGLNGVLHLLSSLATGTYSPGAVTGAVLYLPLAIAIWRNAGQWAERRLHVPAFLAAFLLHGV